jgi:hypothetical protein
LFYFLDLLSAWPALLVVPLLQVHMAAWMKKLGSTLVPRAGSVAVHKNEPRCFLGVHFVYYVRTLCLVGNPDGWSSTGAGCSGTAPFL